MNKYSRLKMTYIEFFNSKHIFIIPCCKLKFQNYASTDSQHNLTFHSMLMINVMK